MISYVLIKAFGVDSEGFEIQWVSGLFIARSALQGKIEVDEDINERYWWIRLLGFFIWVGAVIDEIAGYDIRQIGVGEERENNFLLEQEKRERTVLQVPHLTILLIVDSLITSSLLHTYILYYSFLSRIDKES